MSARTMTNPVALASFISSGALKIQNGFPCGNWNDKGEGIFHLRPFNVSNFGQIDLRSTKFVETNKNLKAYLLQEGDVIFNNTNSEVLVGKTAFWTRTERSTLSNHMTILRVKEREQLDPEFLSFFLLKKWFDRYFESACRRHVNQASISTEQLAALELPILDVPEQKKIAHILSTVQRAIEAQESIIQTTTELKKALMHKLFTEGIPRRSLGEGGPPRNEPQKQTEIGMIPESWSLCKVGDVTRIQSGGTPARDKPEYWNGGTISWVKTGEIDWCIIQDTEEKITSAGLANSAARLFPAGTLLMAMYGQGITRGRVALLAIEAATNQACASITPTEDGKVSSSFLYYWFEYNYENLRKLGHGANQRNMNAALIRSFPVAYPDATSQSYVVEALKSLDAKLNLHNGKVAALQSLFRTLLHELMTAKIQLKQSA